MKKSIAWYAAMESKRNTLRQRIIRYTEYVTADTFLVARGERYERRYGSRLRNHSAKLARYMEALLEVEEALEEELA